MQIKRKLTELELFVEYKLENVEEDTLQSDNQITSSMNPVQKLLDKKNVEDMFPHYCCSCGKRAEHGIDGAKLCPHCNSTVTCNNCELKACICGKVVMCQVCSNMQPCGGCKRLMCGFNVGEIDDESVANPHPSNKHCLGPCCCFCKYPRYCRSCAPNYLDNCYNCHHDYCKLHLGEVTACVSCFRDICANCMNKMFKCSECNGPLCYHCEPDEKRVCKFCDSKACPNCDLTCNCEQLMKQQFQTGR